MKLLRAQKQVPPKWRRLRSKLCIRVCDRAPLNWPVQGRPAHSFSAHVPLVRGTQSSHFEPSRMDAVQIVPRGYVYFRGSEQEDVVHFVKWKNALNSPPFRSPSFLFKSAIQFRAETCTSIFHSSNTGIHHKSQIIILTYPFHHKTRPTRETLSQPWTEPNLLPWLPPTFDRCSHHPILAESKPKVENLSNTLPWPWSRPRAPQVCRHNQQLSQPTEQGRMKNLPSPLHPPPKKNLHGNHRQIDGSRMEFFYMSPVIVKWLASEVYGIPWFNFAKAIHHYCIGIIFIRKIIQIAA